MKWIKKLLGLNTLLEKKKMLLSDLRRQALFAQRNGDLRKYGSITKEVEMLEDEIIEMINEDC